MLKQVFLVAVLFLCVSCHVVEERTVEYHEAIEILNSGQVDSVMQSHSLEVTLILKNGDTIHAVEPRIDDIFDQVSKCDKKCQGLTLATE